MTLWLYRVLLLLLSPVVAVWLALRLLKNKEPKARFLERLGLNQGAKPNGPVVWLHGASVGETLSILPLIKQLITANPTLHVVVTSGTLTSANLMAKHLPLISSNRTHHRFVPLDYWPCVAAFLNHWKPQTSVFVESEWWPELLHQAPNPMLINARISDRSFPRYQKLWPLVRPFVTKFTAVQAQSTHDLARLHALGLSHAVLGGNLKFDTAPLPFDKVELKALQTTLKGRPCILAASTHPGEEEQLLHLFPKLEQALPNVCLIIAPRHPHRGAALDSLITATKFKKARRSTQEPLTESTQIYLADTLGEMGLLFSLANAVLMGGSFVPHGGHNPIEPLQLGTPVLCGPHMFNFKFIMEILLEKGFITQVPTMTDAIPLLPSLCQTSSQHVNLSNLTGATDKARQTIQNALQF